MSLRILLVEDEPGLVLTLSDLLRMEGYDVETAMNGEAGVARALGERFDLILSSLELRASLALHAAISGQNAKLAGRMLIFDRRQARNVIERATELDVGERSYQPAIFGSARAAGGAV